jgi:hypothetical protein
MPPATRPAKRAHPVLASSLLTKRPEAEVGGEFEHALAAERMHQRRRRDRPAASFRVEPEASPAGCQLTSRGSASSPGCRSDDGAATRAAARIASRLDENQVHRGRVRPLLLLPGIAASWPLSARFEQDQLSAAWQRQDCPSPAIAAAVLPLRISRSRAASQAPPGGWERLSRSPWKFGDDDPGMDSYTIAAVAASSAGVGVTL